MGGCTFNAFCLLCNSGSAATGVVDGPKMVVAGFSRHHSIQYPACVLLTCIRGWGGGGALAASVHCVCPQQDRLRAEVAPSACGHHIPFREPIESLCGNNTPLYNSANGHPRVTPQCATWLQISSGCGTTVSDKDMTGP